MALVSVATASTVLRELALKLMANLTDTTDPDPMDRLINVLSRVTPAA